MGRPPNPLILEYFRRGSKLRDKSNRYEHSCKKCGAVDKTGRPEKLIDHLVKCSQLDHEQRQEILARHLNQRSGLKHGEDGMSSRSATPPAYAGLEGLAEAARRVSAHEPPTISPSLQHNSIPIDPTISQATAQFYDSTVLPQPAPTDLSPYVEQPRLADMHETASYDVYNHYTMAGDIGDPDERPMSRPPEVSSYLAAEPGPLPATTVTTSLNTPSNVARSPPIKLPVQSPKSLQSSPSPSGNAVGDPPVMKAFVTPMARESSISSPQTPATTQNIPSSQVDIDKSALTSPPTPSDTGGSSNQSPKLNRPKRTSKLEPQQRARTARIRERGACIRCRLLKKPCSGDDPCQQCQSISNARIWKHPCQRVKLHEEVSLYSVGFQHALCQQSTRHLRESHELINDGSENFVRISFGSHESRIAFKAHRYLSKFRAGNADVEVAMIDEHGGSPFSVATKMKRYLKEEHAQVLEAEQSPVIRSTLRLAKRLALDKNDEVLADTLELWAATLLLTDDTEHFEILLEVNHYPDVRNISVTMASHKQSYETIRGQVRSAIEHNAAGQLHKLFIKLEARMQRPKDCLFETFLACLLLLNCGERMCWFFRQWQVPELMPRAWPLETIQPVQLLEQGEMMAAVLHMVMDMRNVLPKLSVGKEGKLVAPPNSVEDVRTWFNEVELSVQGLKMMEARPFAADDMRSTDGKFGARLFLAVVERINGYV
jgi:hypothetical protein